MTETKLIRLQKIIAESGIASRRQAEALIEDGLVSINGKVAILGQKADPVNDSIKVKGKLLKKQLASEEKFVLAMNKPQGVICSHQDPFHSETIYNLLPKQYHSKKLICAGRLDKNSEGLVLLTNDGDIANEIMHPSKSVTKRYLVTLSRPFEENLIPKLLKGIRDEGEHLFATKVIPIKKGPKGDYQVEVHLEQGRKREIRRLFKAFGYFVDKLVRFQIGKYTLKGISKGGIKKLEQKELDLLFKK